LVRVAYYWFFIPASAMTLAHVAGMCPARDSLLESAALDPKRLSSLLWCSGALRGLLPLLAPN
jgi:hypothetical protein